MDKIIKEIDEWLENNNDDGLYEQSYGFALLINNKVEHVSLSRGDLNAGDYRMDKETKLLYALVSKYPSLLKLLLNQSIDEFISLDDDRAWG